MLNFSSEPTNRNTFHQISTTFRRIFNPILINRHKNKTNDKKPALTHLKPNKLIEECRNSKIHPSDLDHPTEFLNSNQPEEKDCQICLLPLPKDLKEFNCGHRSCDNCLITYLKTEISESRVTITCPECSELLHPNRIQELLSNQPNYLQKYEEFMIRKVLLTISDTRYCPAPDCSYAVIASDCSKCPVLKCGRENCNTFFCFNCQIKCSEKHKCKSSKSKSSKSKSIRKLSKKSKNSLDKIDNPKSKLDSSSDEDKTISTDSNTDDENGNAINLNINEFLSRFNMKPCPACKILVSKIEDGSCNHMTCVCGTQFCWLCIKKTSELHYLSPTGCTFFGKRQWSKKKQLFWQFGMLAGAPIFIALSAAIAIPTIVIAVPVWFGRKLSTKLNTKKLGKFKKYVFVTSGVVSSAVIAPVLAAGAVAIGVPFLLAYVYGVIPIILLKRGKAKVNDTKEQPIKIGDDEAQAFLKHLSEKENQSKKDQKNKSKEKYQVLNLENLESILNQAPNKDNASTMRSKKGYINDENDLMASWLFFDKINKSASKGSISKLEDEELISKKCKRKNDGIELKMNEDNFKIVEVHCDKFGKNSKLILNKSTYKKIEVKTRSLENLANTFCKICDKHHMPCCPNFR